LLPLPTLVRTSSAKLGSTSQPDQYVGEIVSLAGTRIDLALRDNEIRRSCQTDLFMTFSRHATGLGVGEDAYLRNSTYRLTLNGDLRFGDAWFDNPPGLGNTLIVDGAVIGHRTRRFFDEVTCPGTGEPVFPTAAAQSAANAR